MAAAMSELILVRPQWGFRGDVMELLLETSAAGMEAVEMQAIPDRKEARRVHDKRRDLGLQWICEVATGDWWVPHPERSDGDHLIDLELAIGAAVDDDALLVSAMIGSDIWPIARSVDVLGRAMDMARTNGVLLGIETHRSRSLHHPMIALEILRQLPQARVTCDFSHWVVSCERLLEGFEEAVELACDRCLHIHSRVGYEQGPQVPHPESPEYKRHWHAHLTWWRRCWLALERRGQQMVTMNPEYGVDGYQHTLPFSGTPVGSLPDCIRWTARHLRLEHRAWVLREQ
jgi:hypothetical protein